MTLLRKLFEVAMGVAILVFMGAMTAMAVAFSVGIWRALVR